MVTGLPRSRTAWLAALLTAHGAPCCHEAAIGYRRQVALAEIFADGYRGISDPGAAIIYGREALLGAFTDCPVLVVKRDTLDAQLALEKALGRPVENFQRVVDSIAWVEEKLNPLVVDFRRLDDPIAVDQIVQHLTGIPLDEKIFRLFDTLRVEQHIPKAFEAMKGISWLS